MSSDVIEIAENIRQDLSKSIRFLLEADSLKTVSRHSLIVDGSRVENSAEHSWHLALCALILAPHADERIDILRVVSMLLVHDLVEIDAGDVCIFDDIRASTHEKEKLAADRIFRLLPGKSAAFFLDLWREFVAGETPSSRFAATLDRLQPVLLSAASGGSIWREYSIGYQQARGKNAVAEASSADLFRLMNELLAEGLARGLLADDRNSPPPTPGRVVPRGTRSRRD